MDLTQWITTFLQISASELSLNLSQSLTINSFLFTVYLVVSVVIRKAAFIAAFFMSCLLFNAAIFDPMSEASLYLITFAMYSYVILCNGLTLKSRIACGIILILSLILAYDAYFYGVDGYYGAHETIVYNNIEYLSLYAHIIFISSFVNITRIKNSLRNFVSSIVLISRHSANFVVL